jgi:hypothetical protein
LHVRLPMFNGLEITYKAQPATVGISPFKLSYRYNPPLNMRGFFNPGIIEYRRIR